MFFPVIAILTSKYLSASLVGFFFENNFRVGRNFGVLAHSGDEFSFWEFYDLWIRNYENTAIIWGPEFMWMQVSSTGVYDDGNAEDS